MPLVYLSRPAVATGCLPPQTGGHEPLKFKGPRCAPQEVRVCMNAIIAVLGRPPLLQLMMFKSWGPRLMLQVGSFTPLHCPSDPNQIKAV